MEEQKHIAELMLEYVLSLGVTAKDLNELKGLWTNVIDKHWTIKMNPSDKEIESISPFSWYIEFNGWPAGIISIVGDGVICAGEMGNEENLRKAIEDKMQSQNG